MDIQRINTYNDPRFSAKALRQHGCYLVDGAPCEVLILTEDTARVTGTGARAVIDEFRFNAPHITRFVDTAGHLLAEFPPVPLLTLSLADIQPSQFYVDEEKLAAVSDFIHAPEDVIIQVLPHAGKYIALDGHTRLYLAVQRAWTHIRAVAEETDEYIFAFVEEARRRGIFSPADMMLIPHVAYEEKWNKFCDDFFAAQNPYPPLLENALTKEGTP